MKHRELYDAITNFANKYGCHNGGLRYVQRFYRMES